MTEAGELTSEVWIADRPKAGSVGKASPGNVLKVTKIIQKITKGQHFHINYLI